MEGGRAWRSWKCGPLHTTCEWLLTVVMNGSDISTDLLAAEAI
jgi:hypothetical protein